MNFIMTFSFFTLLSLGFFSLGISSAFAVQGAYPQVGDVAACGGGKGGSIQLRLNASQKVQVSGGGDGYQRKLYSLQKTGPYSVTIGVNPNFSGPASGQVKQIFNSCLPFSLAAPELSGGSVQVQYDSSAPKYTITATETRKSGSGVPYWNHWPLRWTSTTGGRSMQLNCGIVRHELLHAVGLPDEYGLSAHGNGGAASCQGSRNNIMNIYAKSNTAGLAADQFFVIAMPYCKTNARFRQCIGQRKQCSTPGGVCAQHANITGPNSAGQGTSNIAGDFNSKSNTTGDSLLGGQNGQGGPLGGLLQALQGNKEEDGKKEQAQTTQVPCTLSSDQISTLKEADALPPECASALIVGAATETKENSGSNNNEAGNIVSLTGADSENKISNTKVSSTKVSSVEGGGLSPTPQLDSSEIHSKANWKSGWSEAVLLESDGKGNAIEGEGSQQSGENALKNTPDSNQDLKRSVAQEQYYEPGGPYTPASLKGSPEVERHPHRLLFENIRRGFSIVCLDKIAECNRHELKSFRQ